MPKARGLATFLISICMAFILGGCQFYSSSGRSLFESAAPGELATTNVGTQSKNNDSTNSFEGSSTACWSQPKDEKLWFAKSGQEYKVKFIDDSSIEVCLANSDEDSH